ncbi:MAG: gliding motility-associated C-terminal domain-containing protein [Bacteroidetes bacterium]|nr:gliding motility-associated C-terminal domain-containing protein [Bacteroidota bacterium]
MNLLGKKIVLFFIITFCVFAKVFSQSTCSFSLLNSNFEEPKIDSIYGVSSGWITVYDTTVTGWLTTATDHQIEIWNNGMYSMNAYSGNQWVELNANEVAALYQDAVTVPGTTLNFGFAHRGRDGIDVMKLEVGPPGGPYTTIGNYSTDNSAWVYYTGTYLVPAGQTSTRFYFTSVSSSSGSNGMGNLLDDINIQGVNVTMELNTQTSCNRIDVVSVAPPGISLEYSLSGGAFQNNSFFTNLNAGNYKVSMRIGGVCVREKTIFVPGPGVLDLGPDQTICVNDAPVTIAANGTFSSYLWDSGESTSSITTNTAGKHKLTVATAFGCPSSDSINVIVNPLPVFDLGADKTYCAGATPVTFSAGAVFSAYSWDSGENTASINTIVFGKHKLTVTDVNGCSSADSVNLIVGALPVFDLGIDQSICANGTKATFDVGAVFTKYLWDSGENTKTISTSLAGKHKVTATDAFGCSASDSINLIVNPLPVFDLGLDKNICDDGSSATFDVGALFASYLWDSGENTKAISTSIAGKHKVTVTDANTCSASDSINLIVNPLPVFDLGVDQSICANGSKATFDVGAVFTKYLWDSGEKTKTLITSVAGKHKVTATDAFGCSASDSVNLTLNAAPTINIGPDLSVCENVLPMQFSIVVEDGTSVLWNNGNTTPSIALDKSGLYIVTVSNKNGCSKTDSLWLQVKSLPSVDLGPDMVLCETSLPMNLNAGAGMDKYKWGSGDSTQMKAIDTSGVYTVEVSKKGCVKKSSVKVFVEQMPVLSLDKKRSICDGAPIVVYAKTDASKILWSTGDSTAEINIDVAGDYEVTLSNGLACVIHEKVTVRSEKSPIPVLEDTVINCFAKNSSLELNATTNAVNYFWNDSSSNATNYVNQEGLYVVGLISDKGCVSIDSIYVKELCAPSFFVPNAFTPNNDTKNDVFYVESTEEVQDYELRIFNRWGEVIYKTNSIYDGWNGQLKSGQQAQEEVYVWLINYRYATISGSRAGSMNGTVTLLR